MNMFQPMVRSVRAFRKEMDTGASPTWRLPIAVAAAIIVIATLAGAQVAQTSQAEGNVAGSSQAVTTSATTNPTGGQYVAFTTPPTSAGAYMEFNFLNTTAGNYNIIMYYRGNTTRATVQASIDGTNIGSPCNEYNATTNDELSFKLGAKYLAVATSANYHKFRITGTGSTSSPASYQQTLNYLQLNPNTAPTVSAATATPSPATGTTTALSATATDDGGEGYLTYTWSATGTPPAPVTFSVNGTNAAKASTVTFTKAGNYTLRATVSDGVASTTRDVTVTVNQTITTVTVAPASASVATSATQQFTATAYDQFATAFVTPPTFTWTVSSGGTISTGGLFTAGTTAGGPYTVTASSGGKSGTAQVTITSGNTAPTITTPAAISPNPVTGTTGALSVVAADNGGEPNLVYTWDAPTIPSGASTPTFSPNGTNPAKNSTVTFNKAGSYVLRATVRDVPGLTVTSSVNVTVNQTLTNFSIAPTSATLSIGGSQPFTSTSLDQFGQPMTPTVNWSINAPTQPTPTPGPTTTYTATVTGTFTLQAQTNTLGTTASITVSGGPTCQLTMGNASGGSTTPAENSVTTVPQNTLYTITAFPVASYSFSNWTVTSGTATITNPTAVSTTIFPTSAAVTVQPSFSGPHQAPTDASLTPSSIEENLPVNSVVGTFSATDPEAGSTFTYSLVSGTGDVDNNRFSIVSGNQLIATQTFNYETRSSCAIRVRVTDNYGMTYEEPFTIMVIDVSEYTHPTVTPAASYVLTGPSVTVAWSAVIGASSYELDIGSAVGRDDLYNGTPGLVNSVAVTGLPEEGEVIYVRITTIDVGGLHYYDFTYTGFVNPPKALSVSISGTARVGQILHGTYTYFDDDPEGASSFKWYRASDAAGTGRTEITGATSINYTVASPDADRYIQFEVTPRAASGYTNGQPTLSATAVGPVGTRDGLTYVFPKDCGDKQNMKVNGRIKCNSLLIHDWLLSEKGMPATPDYVFDKGYKLAALSEIERYINTNGHLPEVPSAEELESDGVDMIRLNFILLKKIEEMTLHMITQEKKMREMEQEIKIIKDIDQ